MTDTDRREIENIVREVLKDQATPSVDSTKSRFSEKNPSKQGIAVLNIFHAGVRKLDEALKQVQRIEETARRSSVYTVESARAWVCGADVKAGAGVKCILDTVKREGLEKALQNSDMLILPTLCLTTAAKISNLICADLESGIVFRALLQGKKVLAANDGFLVYDILANEQLRNEIERVLQKLERYGVVLCPTDQLYATFQKNIAGNPKPKAVGPPTGKDAQQMNVSHDLPLITAKAVYEAVANGQQSIGLAPGGIVTPLARDLAKEYAIKIIQANIQGMTGLTGREASG